ncbi:MAG: biotin/lipoyl-binding protein [Pseudomonadota bacterium]
MIILDKNFREAQLNFFRKAITYIHLVPLVLILFNIIHWFSQQIAFVNRDPVIKNQTTRRSAIFNRLIVATAVAALTAGCSGEAATPLTVQNPIVRPAKLLTIETSQTREIMTFPAIVQADEFAELTFQVSGDVREINFLEGDQVTKDDIIAALDSRNAENLVTQTQSEYNNANAQYERALLLINENAIARSVVETRRTALEVARCLPSIVAARPCTVLTQ